MPESPVLVGAIKRKKDFVALRDEHWYRIPEGKAPQGLYADVLAFFTSSASFKNQNGGIYYYALRQGMELVRRRDLFPDEANHPRAGDRYHKIQLSPLQDKIPPILNRPRPYRFAFIYTTWDRFQSALHIRDLYSDGDYFVDRVFHALRQSGLKPQRRWEAAYPATGAIIRVLCEDGTVIASTGDSDEDDEFIRVTPADYEDGVRRVVARIRDEIKRKGGPKMVDLPVELY